MSCLDPLVRIDNSSDKLPTQRRRFAFDLSGHLVAVGLFRRPYRSLVVDSTQKVECSTELRIPDREWDSIRVEILYKARCPFSSEEALARALYHDKDEPKKVLDRIIFDCVTDYVRGVGEQQFFDEFYSRHYAGLRDSLPGKVTGRATIILEDLSVRVKTEVSPNLAIHFSSEPFDLADNCLGVPLIVHADFEVDTATPTTRGRALQRASRLSAFEKSTRESIKTFFRKIPLHRIHRHADEVSAELKAYLKPAAEAEGRVVNRLVVGINSSADQVIPFDTNFECRLADGTDLSVDVSGALWVADVGRTVARTDWKKPEELQRKLSIVVQALVREKLAKYSYTEFHPKVKSVWEEIASALQSEGTRAGVRVSLNWRTAWPFDWLIAGEPVSRIVECEVGEERVKCRLLVAMDLYLADSSGVRSHPSRREEFLAAIGETVDHTATHLLQTNELSEYYAFETQFRERLGRRIAEALLNKFGVRASGLQFQRKDNLAAQNMVEFVQHAPILVVQHPSLPNIVYEVHYRVVAYASSVGFPVYPKDIGAVSAALSTTIRQFLSDLPSRMFSLSNKDALQQLAKQRIPQTMEIQHRLRVDLLNWIPASAGDRSMPDHLAELIHQLVIATDPMDQADMRKRALQIALLLQARGEPVPVDELKVVGVDCALLALPPADERKALGASGDQ